jgi:subfamily B ATP-binding cassette protein MsbA
LPDIWVLVKPRRGILLIGFVLMAINRVCGLALPASTKFLIDDIIGKRRMGLLVPLVLAVVAATLIQGITSFTLTQLLSKAAQRLIAELRRKVQAHIGRLPVTYFDSNKSGAMVSRIMNDVEGIRNLIGTGLVEFVGGLLTSVIALAVLIKISPLMTGVAVLVIVSFAFVLSKAFRTIRPIFRERGKINAEVTGRLTESLGGVRVVKGYHAEAREAEVFGAGAQRLLNNVLRSLTAMSLMSLSATVLMGVVGATVMFLGTRQIFAGTLTLGGFMTFTAFLAFLVAPVFQIVGIGTQITEALAGLDRTHEVLAERPEDKDPRRTVKLGPIRGDVVFDHVGFAYDAGKQVLYDVSFESAPGTVTALVGPSGSGKSTMISLIAAFHVPTEGAVLIDGKEVTDVGRDRGMVFQKYTSFAWLTVAENIEYDLALTPCERVFEGEVCHHVSNLQQLFPQGLKIINFSNEHNLNGPVLIAYRLIATLQIDYCQSPVHQTHPRLGPKPFTSRASINFINAARGISQTGLRSPALTTCRLPARFRRGAPASGRRRGPGRAAPPHPGRRRGCAVPSLARGSRGREWRRRSSRARAIREPARAAPAR